MVHHIYAIEFGWDLSNRFYLPVPIHLEKIRKENFLMRLFLNKTAYLTQKYKKRHSKIKILIINYAKIDFTFAFLHAKF